MEDPEKRLKSLQAKYNHLFGLLGTPYAIPDSHRRLNNLARSIREARAEIDLNGIHWKKWGF